MIENKKKIKVLTPNGFMDFHGIRVSDTKTIYHLEFDNGSILKCTKEHRIFTKDGFSFAGDLNVGDMVASQTGYTMICNINSYTTDERVYDLLEVSGGNEYYTNGILSHNCEFVTDDETLINSVLLSELRGVDPSFYTTTVRWFKEPEPNRTYLVSLDPSVGTGGDDAAIEVFEMYGGKTVQVAEWQNNLTPAKGQVALLMNILKFIYSMLANHPDQEGDPEIFWTFENNSIGDSILQVIEYTGEENFPGVLINEKKKKGQTKKHKRGLLTDKRRKLLGCNRMKSLIESHRMVIHSKILLKQLKNFVASGASYAAKYGEHDDLVMSTVLISRMVDTVIEWSLNDFDELKDNVNDEMAEDTDDSDPEDYLPVLV